MLTLLGYLPEIIPLRCRLAAEKQVQCRNLESCSSKWLKRDGISEDQLLRKIITMYFHTASTIVVQGLKDQRCLLTVSAVHSLKVALSHEAELLDPIADLVLGPFSSPVYISRVDSMTGPNRSLRTLWCSSASWGALCDFS